MFNEEHCTILKVNLPIIWKLINLQRSAIDLFPYGKNIGHKRIKNRIQNSVETVNPLMPDGKQ